MRSVRSVSSLVATVVPFVALAGLGVFAAPRAAHAQSFNYNFATSNQGFTSTFGTAGTAANNTTAQWVYNSTGGVGGTGAWATPGVGAVAQVFLTSPNLVLTQSGTITGSFTHRFNFEGTTSTFDAGIIEYTTDAGITWTQVGTSLVTGQGYNGTVSTSFSNPLAGKTAFAHTSTGYATPAYVTTNFTLGTTAAQSFTAGNIVQFRFNAGYDSSTFLTSPDWQVGAINFNVNPAAAAPEPGSLSLLGMGLAGGAGTLGVVRRKRKSA